VIEFFRVADLILIVLTIIAVRMAFKLRLQRYAYKNARVSGNFHRNGQILDDESEPSQRELYRRLHRKEKELRALEEE
jgi:hypothetical protein